MNIILLSGGSGKRLWPLSNDVRSKQFIKLFNDGKCGKESMVQRMYRKIKEIDENATVTIATSKSQISELKNQLSNNINISMEPCRKDTFPAIVLATLYLRDVEKISEKETVVVCPVDPYVDDSYFEALKRLSKLASTESANIVLMGIEPTYASSKYGYIIPTSSESISKVSKFKEKPDSIVAQQYIDCGGLWNSGIFAFKIDYLLKKAHELIEFSDYKDLFSKYGSLTKISFDYAVVEKEPNIEVMRFSGKWEDLGSWNTLTECIGVDNIGKVIVGDGSCNNHIINTLDMPVLCIGVSNLIIASSPDGILVSSNEGTGNIKKYVEKINSPIRFSEKSWGEYKVIDISKDSMTIKIDMEEGRRMSYHSHKKREEVWTIISGVGLVIVDSVKRRVRSGDVITLKAGTRHTIIAESPLTLIEVQIGKDIDVKDKQKFELK